MFGTVPPAFVAMAMELAVFYKSAQFPSVPFWETNLFWEFIFLSSSFTSQRYEGLPLPPMTVWVMVSPILRAVIGISPVSLHTGLLWGSYASDEVPSMVEALSTVAWGLGATLHPWSAGPSIRRLLSTRMGFFCPGSLSIGLRRRWAPRSPAVCIKHFFLPPSLFFFASRFWNLFFVLAKVWVGIELDAVHGLAGGYTTTAIWCRGALWSSWMSTFFAWGP